MKTIIAGSREANAWEVDAAIRACPWTITSVICGCARGADTLGRIWAERNRIPVIKMPADWNTHGKNAGRKRNEEMADVAEGLLAVWDGQSPGTRHMILEAERRNLPTYIHRYYDLVYVWDSYDNVCYTTERNYTRGQDWMTVLGDVRDPGPRRHDILGHGIGTQADLERACREQVWWNPAWTFPPLGVDPIPF